MTRRGLTILFSGMIAGDPWQGGATWAVLQYLLGFRRLGHDVLFVEPVKPSSLRPAGATLAESANASYFQQVAGEFDLLGRSALLLDGGTTECFGLPYPEVLETCRRADVLINVSGMLADPTLLERVPVRAYLDLDPGFVQMWQAVQGIDMRFDGHTHFLTVGQSIGRPECPVPTCGRQWVATLPPVVLEQWPMSGPEPPAGGPWTTIANWRGYGSIEHDGVFYGQKAHSLRTLIDLPGLTAERLELALAIHPQEVNDLSALRAHGWRLLDPQAVAATPAGYRRFVQNSKGEFGVAKSGYVASRSGWFSDRSACYLASGRPVVAQDSGFSRHLPTGEGLLAFDTADAAAASLERVARDYARHSRAARQLAEECFDSDKVLGRLLDMLGAAS
jgi:hypothetical protein